jgi:MraZ protein
LSADEKGRIAMPARYRQSLLDSCGGQLFITTEVDRDRFLLIFPSPTWIEIEQRLGKLPDYQPGSRDFKRHLIGNAQEVEMDKQGRLLIPPELRKYANLAREVMLVGKVNGFELWDVGAWHRRQEEFLAASQAGALELPDEFKSLTL